MADEQPKVPTYEYYGEMIAIPDATVDLEAAVARLNELGRDGWKLVGFTRTIAWFVR